MRKSQLNGVSSGGQADANKGLTANRGHVWETDKDGTVNIMAWNPADPHNGPRCVKCGYGYCHHCLDGPDEDCPLTDHTP